MQSDNAPKIKARISDSFSSMNLQSEYEGNTENCVRDNNLNMFYTDFQRGFKTHFILIMELYGIKTLDPQV